MPSIRSTVQANLDLFRSIRKLTASESAKNVRADLGVVPAEAVDVEEGENLAYDAARLIRSEGWLALRSHVVSYKAHSGILEELA